MYPRHLASWAAAAAFVLLVGPVVAQSSNSTSPASSPPAATSSASPLLSLTTSSFTSSFTTRSGTSLATLPTVVPTIFNVTVTPTASSTSSVPSNSTTASATPTPDPRQLQTKIDPGFGVLGALLIITGIPSAFLGHKNRWSSFFLVGFYTLSLVCFVLILRFGVLEAVNPPSTTLRGLFVLACTVAGFVGGGVAIFFWKATRYFIGAWGGLAFALWIQCFRDGGLIHEIGFRWILYIACAVVGFILCTIPRLHYYTLIVSTGFVGATAFMLGVDCYTTADLKEFYIWNLGFNTLFTRYVHLGIQFPVSQTMEIELGLLGAVALMGIAVQLRILKVLQRKLQEIREEQRRVDKEVEAHAAEQFAEVEREKTEWEREHPTLLKHGRNGSNFSGTPLMKDVEMGLETPSDEKRASTYTLIGGTRQRVQSGVSSLMLSTPMAEGRQSPGALPALDLGTDLEADVPQNYISNDPEIEERPRKPSMTLSVAQELEELKRKQELLSEIQNIRKSIDLLKAETPAPSSSTDSRRPSFSSRRTLSYDLGSIPLTGPSHLRPPRPSDPRARVQSMELSRLRSSGSSPVGRPTSVPLQDDGWDAYVQDRRLLQPPSGVTPPIATTPGVVSPKPKLAVSPAVTDALLRRQHRESSLSYGNGADQPPSADVGRPSAASPRHWSPEELPPALRPSAHKKSDSQGSYNPGVVLPRTRNGSSPQPKRDSTPVLTFEELEERHREKLRQLQQPLTDAEKEQADIRAAKSRWERAKQMEKQAVTKRQAEQAAAVSREAKEKTRSGDAARHLTTDGDGRVSRHNRTLSADALATVAGKPSSSKRMSTMKVEDWQKSQTVEPDAAYRESRRQSAVPFPGQPGRPSGDRRRSSHLLRDPPS
ncbi:hypothetical protein PHLGIDRAFT_124031 [Phlebiopsis gigantea 11061_1 CR5-6]|uniref:TM7S3/TM198-like domain-containing protein n=1 Tax=Phlebiopsis gigantea (strain 11061_1 CR5-6) TaxID=745531 RepID=A0A0C3PWS5_PHLG1|nr:hypothetical protein PHLGIDRAFT_124031 [Phlebiopsis gigantea 11061_1 CR5-6]